MYSLEEMQQMLADWEAKAQSQAPYFDARLLSKIANIKQAIEECSQVNKAYIQMVKLEARRDRRVDLMVSAFCWTITGIGACNWCRFLLCDQLHIFIYWWCLMDYKKLALEIACFIVGVTGGLAAFTLLIWIIWRI